jgi:phenylalanyl-tRNA synthetase beta subunit
MLAASCSPATRAVLPSSPPFEPATVRVGEAVIGMLGLVEPRLTEARDIPRHDKVYVAEIDLDLVWYLRGPAMDAMTPLPRFPAVVRDLSIRDAQVSSRRRRRSESGDRRRSAGAAGSRSGSQRT